MQKEKDNQVVNQKIKLKKKDPHNLLILDDDEFIDPKETLKNYCGTHNISGKYFTAEQYNYYKTFNPFKQDLPQILKFKQFSEEKWKLKDSRQQAIICQLIQTYEQYIDEMAQNIATTDILLKLLKPHHNKLIELSKSNNPRVIFLLGLYQFCNDPIQKKNNFFQIAAKQLYPKAISFLAFIQKNQKIKLKMLIESVQFGDKLGILCLALFYEMKSQFEQAFKYYYNAGQIGLAYGWKKVAEFYLNGLGRKKNLKTSLKYAYKCEQSAKHMFLNLRILTIIQQLQSLAKRYQNTQKQLVSTKIHQASYILNFLFNRQGEIEKQKDYPFGSGMTNNTQPLNTFQNCIPKKFFIIVPTNKIFPSKGFLVQDQKGTIQQIYIYNWNLLPLQKYKLLFQLGTKINLNYYIRKQGANDLLPMYRIENPHWIQIYPRKQKHYLRNQKIRDLCKELFKNGFFRQCITLYNFIIQRQGQQLDIVYSNKSLCLIKLNKISEAITAAECSLKVNSQNQKSLMRLVECYCIQNEYLNAKKWAIKLKQSPQKQVILTKINDNLKQQQSSMDLGKKKYMKKKQKRQKVIITIQSLKQKGISLLASELGYLFPKMVDIITTPLGMDSYSWHQKQAYTIKLIEVPLTVQICEKNIKLIRDSLKMTYEMIKNYFTNSQKMPVLDSAQNYVFFSNNKNVGILFTAIQKNSDFQTFQNQFDKVAYDYVYDLAYKLSLRASILQDKIQNFCIDAQFKEKETVALKLYQCGLPYNILFAKNYSDILLKLNNHKQNIEFCNKMIEIINRKQNNFFSYWNYINFELKKIRSLKQVKSNDTLKQAKQLYNFIVKNSPKLIYQKYQKALLTQMTIFQSLATKQNDQNVKFQQKTGSLKKEFVQICKLISLLLYQKKNFHESLDFINLAISKSESNVYQLFIQKTRILIKLDMNEQALKLIQIKLTEFKNGKVLNKQIYKNAFFKLKLEALTNLNRLKEFVQFAKDLVKLDYNNINFIEGKIAILVKKSEQKLQQIVPLLKNYGTLEALYQKFKIYLRALQKQKQLQKQKEKQIQKELQESLQNKINNQDLQDINKFYQIQNGVDHQIIDFKQIQKYYKGLKAQIDKLQEQETAQDQISELNLQQNLQNQFQGYQAYFYHQKQLYIVIFQPNLHIEKKQLQRFRQAAGKGFCRRFYGSNGIKILNQELVQLKINSGNRLVGKVIDHYNKKLVIFDSIHTHQQIKKKL